MSIKEMISNPKEHILEARQMAEVIFNNTPEIQKEMFVEIKKRLIKLKSHDKEQFETL